MRMVRGAMLGCVLLSSGCLIAGSSEQKRTGHYVADETMSQIKPGRTSAGWVLATLGEPDKKTAVGDGSEVWKWTYTEKKESSGAVFLIFGGSDKKEVDGAAFVEVRDGVVVKAWRG
jgi:outer membrane protein assembly factor BamE (lipoprotein component of BamABCDE complex)